MESDVQDVYPASRLSGVIIMTRHGAAPSIDLARKSIQQGQRVRRNGPVLVSQVLEGQGLNAPSIGA